MHDKRGDGPPALDIPTWRGAPDADDWGSDQYMGYCGCFWESAKDITAYNDVNHKDALELHFLRTEYLRTKRARVVIPFFKVFKVVSLDAKLSRG